MAALESIGSFGARSRLRTWLTSILRFKVVDLQRRAVAERVHVELDEEGEAGDEGCLDERFDGSGHWRVAPQACSNPRPRSSNGASGEAFERCLDALTKTGGRVFFKREVLGEDTAVICKAEGITASNCWVILHRSRLMLRACLEKNWFAKEGCR